MAFLSFLRTFGLIVLFLTILPDVLGVKGVWLAVPAAELGAMAVAVFCLFEGQRAFCLKTGQQ